ncbi:hypothetical protein K4F52_001563 [Lecanicillium sp. MT-2017a]|nr:hypothetical protein K4F52_001563 [Lecanicillium sp. MT-2017a]
MAYSKPQHAHPTAYYVFDMLFKLVMSGALIGIVAVLAVGVADAKSKSTQLIELLETMSIDVDYLADYLRSIDSTLSRMENDLSR